MKRLIAAFAAFFALEVALCVALFKWLDKKTQKTAVLPPFFCVRDGLFCKNLLPSGAFYDKLIEL